MKLTKKLRVTTRSLSKLKYDPIEIDCDRKNGLTIEPYITNPAYMKKPPKKRLVAKGLPLILSNSFIFIVMIEMPFIPIYPITKQIILEIKARINQRNKEKSNPDPIIL
jgi:hypothetical protein